MNQFQGSSRPGFQRSAPVGAGGGEHGNAAGGGHQETRARAVLTSDTISLSFQVGQFIANLQELENAHGQGSISKPWSLLPSARTKTLTFEVGRTCDETQGNECKLHKLVVGVSILPRNPESGWIVAVGLGEIFSSLSEVVGYGSEGPKWEQVGRNIKMLRQAHRTMQQQGLYHGKQSQSTSQLSNPPPLCYVLQTPFSRGASVSPS